MIRRQNRLGSANLPTNLRRIRRSRPMIDPIHRMTRPSPSHSTRSAVDPIHLNCLGVGSVLPNCLVVQTV